MDPENTIEQTPEELEIANAFAEFVQAAEPVQAADPPPVVAAAPVVEPAQVAPAQVVEPVQVAPAQVVEPAQVVPAQVVEPAQVAPAQVVEPVEDPRIADLQTQIEALKPKTPAAPIYTAEEETVLKKYAEDWPDIQKAEALARRSEYRELVGYVFQQFNQELAKVKAEYTPALEYVETRSGQDQYSGIVRLVPDYDQVRDKTLAWIDTQPAWLKSAYSKVASEGTAEEVAGLIGLYKKETAYVAPATSVAQTVVAKPAVVAPELSLAAKQAAAKLTVVKTNRTEAGTIAEETFENAFAAYAAEEDKRLSRK